MRLHLVRGNTVLAKKNTENIIPISPMWGMWKKYGIALKKYSRKGLQL